MLGESGGRSARNPITGRRRFNENERAQRTHQTDDPEQWPDLMRPSTSVRRASYVVTALSLLGVVLLLALTIHSILT